MQGWIERVFEAPQFGWSVLPASLLLGLLSAVASSGCTIAMLGAVAGYAGSREEFSRRHVFLACGTFMVGTILALAVLGALIGHFGGLAGGRLGTYGKMASGFVVLFFGLVALRLHPFRLPTFTPLKGKLPKGVLGAAVFGLAFGGGSIACTMACCGPLLPVVLGLAALRGQVGWGALIMTLFAIGYSVPMAAIMLGVSLGRTAGFAKKATEPIRVVAGLVLVGAGFYLLATL